jgi:hypothetical protein
MAAPREKSLCVLEYRTSRSVVIVQCAFRAKYATDPPTDKTIRARYKQFPPLPRDLADLKARIIAAVKNIDAPMLTRACVWQELECHVDVCRGAHIERL